MKSVMLLLVLGVVLNSCIPVRIAPSIKDYKITKGKRFKRGLPKKTVFVFEDSKNADEFYNYINTKFQLQDYYVDTQVPFQLGNEQFYLSFYEVEIHDKAINLFPIVFDLAFSAAVGNDEIEPVLSEDAEPILRSGNWYIAIEVFSNTEKDCLREDSISKDMVLPYLRNLKQEYLSTHNYNEVVFKN
ncbi:hypothetical protein DKG77_03285 [Flagellimonas aquimarina]|uniref:Uncharacterized protein n=1 Tax=Flagellimonas aquimarina TaxID=2201895 RepID=A0A316L038_9FLAO|nr:hypothetical protein [Allomuricauda koreensis]PWL39867.1 hypothetical protein DKG77_03285 [Allomuricauda koreensis]